MTFNHTEHGRAPLGGLGSIRSAAAVLVAFVGSAAVLAGCTSSHPSAAAQSSAPASSAPVSSPAAAFSSVPISAFPASPLASADPSLASPVSSQVPGAALIANIEAPATKGGFQVRLHRGSTLKVTVPQAKAGTPVVFTLIPTTATFLTPIAGHDGYFSGAQDGVVNVTVTQGGAAIGTLSVTVWG
jgi:hypothetical protein